MTISPIVRDATEVPNYLSPASRNDDDEQMEPFDMFKLKVTALCQHLWHTLPSSAIAITRMEDGFFHRVISVTITRPPQPLHWFTEFPTGSSKFSD